MYVLGTPPLVGVSVLTHSLEIERTYTLFY